MWRTTSVGCHSNPRIGQSFYGAVVFRHIRARPRARIVAPTLAQGAVADPQRRLMAETECGASGQGRAFGASTALLRRHWWSKSNAWFPQRMTELSPICPKGVIEALPDSTSSEPQSDIRRASFDNTESRVAGR